MSDDHKQRVMNAMRKFDERVSSGKFKPKREKKKKDPDAMPTEHQEQVKLVGYMRRKGWTFCAIPNGGSRSSAIEGARLRASGLQRGFPDLLLFWPVQAAIELKRQKGGRVSDEQRAWLDTLEGCGWKVQVCKGADAAIEWLEEICDEQE
jgi:hypothetical protein